MYVINNVPAKSTNLADSYYLKISWRSTKMIPLVINKKSKTCESIYWITRKQSKYVLSRYASLEILEASWSFISISFQRCLQTVKSTLLEREIQGHGVENLVQEEIDAREQFMMRPKRAKIKSVVSKYL